MATATGTAAEITQPPIAKVGQPAPDFSLEDVNGKTITLSELRDKKNVVLVFYRGYW